MRWAQITARSVLLVALVVLAGQVSAQARPLLFYGSSHVLVDPTTPAGQDYLKRLAAQRPTPLSEAVSVEKGARLGNLEIDTESRESRCGSRTSTELVLCVNEQGLLSYSDSLAALAFASAPTVVRVPSVALRQYMATLLEHLPNGAHRVDLSIALQPCAEACARQIRLERGS